MLDCTGEYFVEWIDAWFDSGMTWENTHIDHLKPLSKFDLSDDEQLEQAFHYTNCRPLLARDNRSKSNRWTAQDEENWLETIIHVD